MKNIPVFTTELGVASLILQEIAYKQQAYIRIQSTANQSRFIKECADFCCAAGAKEIYLTGECIPNEFPLYTRIISMVCNRNALSETDAVLVPVTKQTIDEWRRIHNTKMKNVPCSATLTMNEMEKFLASGTLYYIRRRNERIGIGKISNNKIDVVASCVHGAGKDLVLALNTAISADTICVEVSDKNMKAVNLYRTLGFVESEEIARWYCYK